MTYFFFILNNSLVLLFFCVINLYIHIPFCRKACHYCNFHFSTGLAGIPDFLSALYLELGRLRERYAGEHLRTIYLGGGTPSVLSVEQIAAVYEALAEVFSVAQVQEFTLEMNPEDADLEYLQALRDRTAVDRISLGIQSLDDRDLKWMNRGHDAHRAVQAIKDLQEADFPNISADLIFGYDQLSNTDWERNLQNIIELQVPHISHYGLSVEPQTVFAYMEKKGMSVTDEAASAQQMLFLYRTLEKAGYTNYELSNSALPGYEAVHNSGYWKGQAYLGLGPAAHGYDGDRLRYQNISNNVLYAHKLREGEDIRSEELLNDEDLWQEFLMTKLRTKAGIEFADLRQRFGVEAERKLRSRFGNIPRERYEIDAQRLCLTYEGWIWSDAIFVDIFD